MHELSIALSIVDLAAEEAEARRAQRVAAVYLRLGPLSGVVPEALRSAWELACEGSPVAGARLVIEHVPIVVYCPACGGERPARSIQDLCCDTCGGPPARIVRGRELEVTALELIEREVIAHEHADATGGSPQAGAEAE
jgi:hydrogenase nickel incorporation protein HypA/HybF